VRGLTASEQHIAVRCVRHGADSKMGGVCLATVGREYHCQLGPYNQGQVVVLTVSLLLMRVLVRHTTAVFCPWHECDYELVCSSGLSSSLVSASMPMLLLCCGNGRHQTCRVWCLRCRVRCNRRLGQRSRRRLADGGKTKFACESVRSTKK
jgi:hypothetical protein